jgi:hypothetical protein
VPEWLMQNSKEAEAFFLGKYEISEEFMLYSIKLNNDTHRCFHLPEKIVIKVYLAWRILGSSFFRTVISKNSFKFSKCADGVGI